MDWGETRDALVGTVPVGPMELGGVLSTGVYAWWDLGGALAQYWPAGFPVVDATRPLYVGLTERQSLSKRGLGMHLKTTRMSTLRRSLSALLVDELELRPCVVPAAKVKFSLRAEGELRLTEWMLANLTVTWVGHDAPGSVEADVIGDLLSPLNDRFAHDGEYWQPMGALRKRLWMDAGGRSAGPRIVSKPAEAAATGLSPTPR